MRDAAIDWLFERALGVISASDVRLPRVLSWCCPPWSTTVWHMDLNGGTQSRLVRSVASAGEPNIDVHWSVDPRELVELAPARELLARGDLRFFAEREDALRIFALRPVWFDTTPHVSPRLRKVVQERAIVPPRRMEIVR